MAAANYEPNWPEWLLYREVTIEAAVALSMNVDPDSLFVWKMRAQPTQRKEFERRVSRVMGWPLRRPNRVAEAVEGHTPQIYLSEFVQYAVKADWPIPAPLMTLATAKSDRHSRSRKRGAGAADPPKRRSSRPKRRALEKSPASTLTPLSRVKTRSAEHAGRRSGPRSNKDEMRKTLKTLIKAGAEYKSTKAAWEAVIKKLEIKGEPRGWGYRVFVDHTKDLLNKTSG